MTPATKNCGKCCVNRWEIHECGQTRVNVGATNLHAHARCFDAQCQHSWVCANSGQHLRTKYYRFATVQGPRQFEKCDASRRLPLHKKPSSPCNHRRLFERLDRTLQRIVELWRKRQTEYPMVRKRDSSRGWWGSGYRPKLSSPCHRSGVLGLSGGMRRVFMKYCMNSCICSFITPDGSEAMCIAIIIE